MTDKLIKYIENYLIRIMLKNVRHSKVINRHFDENKCRFTFGFEVAGTKFIVVANKNIKKGVDMVVTPDENRIKIVCYDFMNNIHRVRNFIENIEQELRSFNITFPSSLRLKYINENLSLMDPNDRKKAEHSELLNIPLYYIVENDLMDDYHIKEIALSHLFQKDYFNKMKKLENNMKSKKNP